MSWASKRQFQYVSGLVLFLALVACIILYPILTKKPTCFDNKQNGTETGVDCGGVCDRVCTATTAEPIILWSRAFPVSGSAYNLVSFVNNQNKNAAVERASYEFRIYDTNNLLIGRREGVTFIPPNQQFAIFEPRFDAGKSIVKSVSFEFTSAFIWVKKPATLQTLPIHVDHIALGDDVSSPSLTAQVNNDSVYDLPPFDVVTILYNLKHNAITASKTHLDGLKSNTNAPLLFTWPQALPEDVVTNDILVQINPFTTSF